MGSKGGCEICKSGACLFRQEAERIAQETGRFKDNAEQRAAALATSNAIADLR